MMITIAVPRAVTHRHPIGHIITHTFALTPNERLNEGWFVSMTVGNFCGEVVYSLEKLKKRMQTV